jgi:hypothetical protein
MKLHVTLSAIGIAGRPNDLIFLALILQAGRTGGQIS